MKKTIKLFSLAALSMLALSFTSCKSDDPDETRFYDQLPTPAQTFISNYFPGIKTTTITYDKKDKEYEVYLTNGYEITFSNVGEWIDVDAPAGQTVPTGIAPATIENYVFEKYPGDGINEIEKVKVGYDVELVSGLDLLFNSSGSPIGINN